MQPIRANIDNEIFTIMPRGNEFELSVEPANRFNGTQTYDGWFPRRYSSPRSAKAALTRFLGESLSWSEEN